LGSTSGFFATLVELCDLYVSSPGTIATLDPKSRAKLSVKERAEADTGLLLGK